jgi:zinc transport system substrate-binding protein
VVVASLYPLADFTRHVAGDRAVVISLVPPGVEPHDWEPSPRDVADARKASVFVYSGAGFEQAADRILKELAGGAGPVPVDASTGIPLLEAPGEGGRARAPRAKDPHVWLDPLLAQRQVSAIAEGLARVDPAGARAYVDNAAAYRARLGELHDAFTAGLARCARREVVTSHAAFGYLTTRYGLIQVPVMGIAPESEPSPADLARLVRFARQRGVTHIFFESLVSPRIADTLARELGAQTLVLNPVEGLTREEAAAGKDYLALMRTNLEHLRAGLGCR